MFDIWRDDAGIIHLKGMFVAGQSAAAEELLNGITESAILDFRDLRYISSSGLGVLLKVQRRLDAVGGRIRIVGASDHIREIFKLTRFDLIFDIK